MIYELYMKNCALVDELRVNFGKGLNILTGETGSGKSIILEALNLCLGGKYDRTFLRRGSQLGEVETVLFVENENFIKQLRNLDIEVDEDNLVVVSRRLFSDGKSTTKINGKNIKVSDLKKVMSLVVDMHGQHQNQALYSKENHLEFFDLYGKSKVKERLEEYKKEYKEYNNIQKQILKLNDNKSEMEVQRERDLLKFQINEIEVANLSNEEYEDLKLKKEVFANSEKIFNSLNEAYTLLHSGQFNSEEQVGKASNAIANVAKYDKLLEEIEVSTNNVLYELEDLSGNIRSYLDNIDFEPYLLNEVQEKLEVINSLRRKYGDTIEDVLDYCSKIKANLDDIDNREEKNNELQSSLLKKEKELAIKAQVLSDDRKRVASELEKELLDELSSLNMKNTKFKVDFKKIEYNENGNDDVEFLVSFNLGEEMKPLYKVASGGEMSRFMLAFKSILSDVDKIDSLIFDEIDTGISGRAAQTVGEKLSRISKEKQLICITHLPQIASFADEHFYIEKNVENDRTYTSIEKLNRDSKKNEIARLISGMRITEKTIEHADEMLDIADEIKK
ncbi:MAG: DNA repair protein RecN [Peptostreptococcus sp.]|uniref:DNA repair protein RecN n=1 Tax=Peptostreptococcus sp. TaxID=1262 RepID=UPI002FC79677